MKRIAMTIVAAMAMLVALPGCQKTVLQWDQLPAVPDTVGLAGPFAGSSHGALLVAGGANFPQGRPWAGATKVWHDGIYVLADEFGAWRKLDQKLPRPLAYGVSLAVRDGVVCLGGGDANQHYADAFLLRWHGAAADIVPLPPMPQPVAFFSGATLGKYVYVAGGRTSPTADKTMHTFWRLDLSQPAGTRKWEILPPWPGRPRMLAVLAAQDDSIFLISGVDLVTTDGKVEREYLRDAYRWDEDPKIGWRRIKDVCKPVAAAPTPAMAMDPHRVLVFGGDKGCLADQVAVLKDDHPGFSRQIHAYLTDKCKWKRYGLLPKCLGPDPANKPELGVWPPVTAPAVWWRGKIVIPNGEVRPGVRTPRVLRAKPLGWTN